MKKIILLSVLVMLFAATSVFAAELTPETFVQADMEARQATIKGMSDRLALLSSRTATVQEETQLNAVTEQQVSAVFIKFGTTQSDHLVYAEKNAAAIADFLEANPDYQATNDSLSAQFSDISNRINTVLAR
ncbi:MAG: hypothetical protein WC156_14920 [Pedobacter sp.]